MNSSTDKDMIKILHSVPLASRLSSSISNQPTTLCLFDVGPPENGGNHNHTSHFPSQIAFQPWICQAPLKMMGSFGYMKCHFHSVEVVTARNILIMPICPYLSRLFQSKRWDGCYGRILSNFVPSRLYLLSSMDHCRNKLNSCQSHPGSINKLFCLNTVSVAHLRSISQCKWNHIVNYCTTMHAQP